MHALLIVNPVIRKFIEPEVKKRNTMYKKDYKKGQEIIKYGIPTDPKLPPFRSVFQIYAIQPLLVQLP